MLQAREAWHPPRFPPNGRQYSRLRSAAIGVFQGLEKEGAAESLQPRHPRMRAYYDRNAGLNLIKA
ncbi:hypothetical protein GCM10010862_53900 [Devosia nitrariae]|uniref:Uncharacterized protein n=1 Tax=Devosia nitrariae TaxID=2071872 RepID=A0ABQ5WDH2_9HYPH|nr:hypothetical protein GCM10010862_53900 [Devosia nitrariae]